MSKEDAMPEITKEWLEAQGALCEAATPGPWKSFRIAPRLKEHPKREGLTCETITQIVPAAEHRNLGRTPKGIGKTILRHEAAWPMRPKDKRFIAAARTGYPALIRWALGVLPVLHDMEPVLAEYMVNHPEWAVQAKALLEVRP